MSQQINEDLFIFRFISCYKQILNRPVSGFRALGRFGCRGSRVPRRRGLLRLRTFASLRCPGNQSLLFYNGRRFVFVYVCCMYIFDLYVFEILNAPIVCVSMCVARSSRFRRFGLARPLPPLLLLLLSRSRYLFSSRPPAGCQL